MPERIGSGLGGVNTNLYTGNTQPVGGNVDVNVGGGVGSTPTTANNNHTFEVNANNDHGSTFHPFIDETLYHDMGNASNRSKVTGGYEIGVYDQPGSFKYNGWATGESSRTTADWKNRTEWKGSTDPNAKGLGAATGPMLKEKSDSVQRFGASWIQDNKLGVQAKVSGGVESQYGSASGMARVFSEVGAKGAVGIGITNKGLIANAQAEARVVAAGAEAGGQISSPSVKLGGQDINLNANVYGRATVEASAGVGGEVQFSGNPPKAVVEGKAGAFAGAKAYGRAGFGIGDIIKVGVYGEGWAGAGAEASGIAGYQDGKFSLGGSAGIGLGLGGKVGVRVDVDVVKAAQIAKDVADVDRNGKLTLNDGATAITKTADLAMTGIEKGVDRTLNTLDADKDGRFSTRDLGLHAGRLKQSLEKALDANGDGKIGLQDVGAAGQRVGQSLAHGAEAVGRGAVRVGEAVVDGAQALGRAAHNLADVNNDGKIGLADVGVAARNVGNAVVDGTRVASQSIAQGARTVARTAHNLADVNNDGKIGLADVGVAARNVGHAVANGVQQAGQGIAQGARTVARTAHNLADANGDGKIGLADVGAAARNVGNAVVGGTQAVGQGIATGARAVASGAKAVASGVASVGRSVANQVGEAASTIADGASRTYKRAQNVVGRVASFFGW